MATYAIGDVHGCYEELKDLLEIIKFDPSQDTLWFTGDMVGRGPQQLSVLRFVKSLGPRAVCVLGNHDLELLAVWLGTHLPTDQNQFLQVLNADADDKEDLLTWLLGQPLLITNNQLKCVLVHAGLPPHWTLAQAMLHACEFEDSLQRYPKETLTAVFSQSQTTSWSESLGQMERLQFVANAYTRMCYLGRDGEIVRKASGPPSGQTRKQGFRPWFRYVNLWSLEPYSVVFGHWAQLQIEKALDPIHRVIHLDSGCVYGRALSAMCLGTDATYSVPSRQPMRYPIPEIIAR